MTGHGSLAVIAATTFMAAVVAAATQAPAPQRDAGGLPAPTTALERGRTVYVLSACHFCHGVDLTRAQMGAADLMHDPLVGADQHGEIIGAIVLAGLPNLQTAMPKYADMTPQQLRDLAAYIHFLRAAGRFEELTSATNRPTGDPRAGQIYFTGAGQCGSCHSTQRDLKGIGKKNQSSSAEGSTMQQLTLIKSAKSRSNSVSILTALTRCCNMSLIKSRGRLSLAAQHFRS